MAPLALWRSARSPGQADSSQRTAVSKTLRPALPQVVHRTESTTKQQTPPKTYCRTVRCSFSPGSMDASVASSSPKVSVHPEAETLKDCHHEASRSLKLQSEQVRNGSKFSQPSPSKCVFGNVSAVTSMCAATSSSQPSELVLRKGCA